MSSEKVQNAHIRLMLPALHGTLIEIVSVMNAPERDAGLLAKAGLSLERALFPPLVLIARLGPIGVVELANRLGRDYTTVSRQVARLQALDLVERRPSLADKRVHEAVATPRGQAACDSLDRAREEMAVVLFADWSRKDFDDLVRLMRRLASTLAAGPDDS